MKRQARSMKRQARRAIARAESWSQWQVYRDRSGRVTSAPKDEHGIMPRRIRRSIALDSLRKHKKGVRRPA